MRTLAITCALALCGCGEAPSAVVAPSPVEPGAPEVPVPASPLPPVRAASRPTAPVAIVITNAAGAPIDVYESAGLSAIDVEGRLAPIDLHLPPHPCECDCAAPERCPCDPPMPRSLAGGESIERAWDGTMRALRPGPEGIPCSERVDAVPGRWLFVACTVRGDRCGSTEVDLPATSPIRIAIGAPARPADCDDAARLRRAVRIALGGARLEGVAPDHLATCDADAAVCDAGGPSIHIPADVPATPPDRCTIRVSPIDTGYHVHVAPRARDGAPIGIASIVHAEAGGGTPLRAIVEASTWAVSADGAITAAGIAEQTSYTHGGTPATISGARVRITNTSDVEVPLRVRRVEWLTGGREVPSSGIAPAAVPARATIDVVLGFEGQSAMVSYGGPAATRATIDAGGRTITVVIEHRIVARSPRMR